MPRQKRADRENPARYRFKPAANAANPLGMAIRLDLQCHPDTPCGPIDGIAVEVARVHAPKGGRRIALRYVVSGNIKAMRAPLYPGKGQRRDELWRHTCFEAFVRVGDSASYHEFNFAPSGDWACYRLDSYRAGMHAEKWAGEPQIQAQVRREPLDAERRAGLVESGIDPLDRFATPFYTLTAALDLEKTGLPIDAAWHVGLSAIVEERNGTLSYWALKHPAGDPDFHHPDCFALELPAARPA
jgi:hypothetical protein